MRNLSVLLLTTLVSVLAFVRDTALNTAKLFNESSPKTTWVNLAAAQSPAAVDDVVTKALAFKAMLTTAQQSTLQQTYTNTLDKKWFTLPCGSNCRNGIQFRPLPAR